MFRALIVSSLLIAASSCGVPKPPVPPPVQPFRTVAVILTQPIEFSTGATVYVDDTGGGATCTTKPLGLDLAYCEVLIKKVTQVSYITVKSKNYEDYRYDQLGLGTTGIQLWLSDNEHYHCVPQAYACSQLPPLVPNIVNSSILVGEGQFFVRAEGRFYLKDNSMFNAYELYLKGQTATLDSYIADRKSLGFNSARVFLTYNNPTANGGLGRLVPSDYGVDYYTKLPDFIQHFSRKGMYVNLVAFGDATTVFGNDANLERQHVSLLNSVLANNPNVLLSWVNEADQPINRLAIINELGRVPGVTTSRGSNGSQAWPPAPYLDWIELHTNDAPEEQRKVGHNCMEIAPNLPCITSETSRAPFKTNWVVGGTKFGFDSAAGSALLNAGATFHYDSGKTLGPMSTRERDLAISWIDGANSVPIICQLGVYGHRADLESPGILRAYQRGTSPACIVLIRK